MLARLREHWDTIVAMAGLAAVAFFAYSIDARVAGIQELDDRWLQLDIEQTAAVIAVVEEVRTAQGIIMGRLEGTGGDLIYQIGLRDGRALCEGGS